MVDWPTPASWPIFTGIRGPVVVPESVYLLPPTDKDLPKDVQGLLKVHPIAYRLENSGWFIRCPTCEEWTKGEGCTVRRLADACDIEQARELHQQREWPAGTKGAKTRFRGMKPDYRLVTFQYN